jgi:uncharacterized UPF0160 family protein
MNNFIIGTHDGVFHADEITACAILKLIRPEAEIIRSRRNDDLAQANIVVDVGGQYDGDRFFDHHQKNSPLREDGSPYSSAGLIWKAFGHLLVSNSDIWSEIDDSIMKPIDAHDNGRTNQGDAITLQTLLSVFNPMWEEDGRDVSDKHFAKLVEFVSQFLSRAILREESNIKAGETVREAENASKNGIIILEQFVPWQRHVSNKPLLIVFPGINGDWKVQTIPLETEWRKNRLDLPEEWAGLNSEDLANITGVKDAVFCHPGRFIAGARSKKGALKLAELALKQLN